ncbi:MAG TPA: DUF721 domain-containing protein [Devosia sp.]|nr:DUF721 domain-containing protein [Devosia sp.]
MAFKKSDIKRRGRPANAGEIANRVLDPVLKKRGFASRDILARWPHIAPPPYNRVSFPERLTWRRGEAGAQGAILFLRCHEAHRLALAHDSMLIAGAVNRYFGYVLVDRVKLSAEPFTFRSDSKVQIAIVTSADTIGKIENQIAAVEDEGLRDALRKLGQGVLGEKNRI